MHAAVNGALGVTRVLLDLDPVIVEIGPFAIRWYGVLMALSIALGFYYFRRDAMKLGYDEDFLYNVVLLAVIGGIIGARAVYVATNWPAYAGSPLDDHPASIKGAYRFTAVCWAASSWVGGTSGGEDTPLTNSRIWSSQALPSASCWCGSRT